MIAGPGVFVGAVAGLIAGSFLATLILRWPQGRSVARGRSACDTCARALGVRDLVPVFSAWAAAGRCRTCDAPIDPLHWRVELACAAIGACALGLFPNLSGVGWALAGWCLLTLALLDWRHFWLPDALTLPLAFLGLTLGQWVTPVTLVDRGFGAAAGYTVLTAIAITYRAVRGRDGLGMGDAKLLGALGAWFGWQALPFILLVASAIGLGVVVVSGRAHDAATRVALGTFLCIAAVPGWLLATSLLR